MVGDRPPFTGVRERAPFAGHSSQRPFVEADGRRGPVLLRVDARMDDDKATEEQKQAEAGEDVDCLVRDEQRKDAEGDG
jgi:hypothetical protein